MPPPPDRLWTRVLGTRTTRPRLVVPLRPAGGVPVWRFRRGGRWCFRPHGGAGLVSPRGRALTVGLGPACPWPSEASSCLGPDQAFRGRGGGSAPRARKPRAGGLSRKRTLRSSAPPSWTFLLLFFAGPQWTGAVGPPDRWRLSSTWRICSPAVPFRRRLPHARNLFSNGAFSARASSCAQDESSGRVWASGTTSARWQRVSLLGRSWSMLS